MWCIYLHTFITSNNGKIRSPFGTDPVGRCVPSARGPPGEPDDPAGGFGERLRERPASEHGDVRAEEGAFRVEAWPLDLLVVPGGNPGWSAGRARGSDADVVVIAVLVGVESELPALPASVAVVGVDPSAAGGDRMD